MKHIKAKIYRSGLPEAELIGSELERQGCEVSFSDSLSEEAAGCGIVVFSDDAVTENELCAAVSRFEAEESILCIAAVSAYPEPEDLSKAGGKLMYFTRPAETGSLVSAVMRSVGPQPAGGEKLRSQVTSVLAALGYPQNKAGFDCLRDAVVTVLTEGTFKVNLKKDVFPAVGRLNSRTASAAEKSISRINKEVWSNAPEQKIREVFSPKGPKDGKLPSVKETVEVLVGYFKSCPYEELIKRFTSGNDTSGD